MIKRTLNYSAQIICVLILSVSFLQAKRQMLGHLDFSKGDWVMVGVSLHNYRILPIQKNLKTFVCDDDYILKQIQEEWVFEEKFEDYCDYHYAFKFYKNGELIETLRANLHCDYITLGGLSYEFEDSFLVRYRRYFKSVNWSRIRFKDLDMLKVAVNAIDKIDNVYWYGDVQQYTFKGSFMIGERNIPWNADRDSLVSSVTDSLRNLTGREDFYVKVHCWYLSDDFEEMTIRYMVYCNEDFFGDFRRNSDAYLSRWRNHFSEQSFVQIVVIGMSKEDYFRVMHGRG